MKVDPELLRAKLWPLASIRVSPALLSKRQSALGAGVVGVSLGHVGSTTIVG
jgi:hypothetical protein